MRTGIRTIGSLALGALVLAVSALALAACGSAGDTAASAPRPPDPVNLTVYVNDSRVSVSPTRAGAGPITFIVTNQASRAESLAISKGGSTLASTAPINPQGTTQVSVDFKPGEYTIKTGPRGRSDAQLSRQSSIRPATLHVGHQRSSSSNEVLQP